jgi:hypothetical protein
MINFNWVYSAGLKTAQSVVKKYREATLDVYKEELTRPLKGTEILYYISQDKYTFQNEYKFRKRISELMSKAHLSNDFENFPDKKLIEIGSFKFVNGECVFTPPWVVEKTDGTYRFAEDEKSYSTPLLLIKSHPTTNNLYLDGKLVFRC